MLQEAEVSGEAYMAATAAVPVVFPAERVVDGPVLYLSTALLRALTRRELTAVLAHELAHLEVRERRATLGAWPAMAGMRRRLQRRASGWRALAEWPAVAMLGLHLDLALAATWRHAALRERLADTAAADVCSPTALARGLLRLTAAQREWAEQDADLVRAVQQGRRSKNLSRVFQRRLELLPARPWLEELSGERVAHPVDSHEPLLRRVEALGLGRRWLGRARLLPEGETAFELLDQGERLEESLSDAQYLLYRARGYEPP